MRADSIVAIIERIEVELELFTGSRPVGSSRHVAEPLFQSTEPSAHVGRESTVGAADAAAVARADSTST